MTEIAATPTLEPRVRDFVADGGPRQAVVWYRLDGEEIALNSAIGRITDRFQRQERISFRVRGDGVHDHLDG